MAPLYRNKMGRFTSVPQTLGDKFSHYISEPARAQILNPITQEVMEHIPGAKELGEAIKEAKEIASTQKIPAGFSLQGRPKWVAAMLYAAATIR